MVCQITAATIIFPKKEMLMAVEMLPFSDHLSRLCFGFDYKSCINDRKPLKSSPMLPEKMQPYLIDKDNLCGINPFAKWCWQASY